METKNYEEEVIPVYYGGDDKLTLQDFKRHISGPLLSVIIHSAILIILSVIIVANPPEPEPADIEVKILTEDFVPPPVQPPQIKPPDIQPTDNVEPKDVPFDVALPTSNITCDSISVDVVSTIEAESVAIGDDITDPTNINVVLTIPNSPGGKQMPTGYTTRVGKPRTIAIEKGGGGIDTEKCVKKALDWLKSVQNPDGSWGDEDPSQRMHMVQLTSMSLLAFLAHGETQLSPDYGPTVQKGLQRIQEWIENPEASHGVFNKGDNYAMARAGIVMSEAYAMTRIPSIERAMNKIIAPFAQKVILSQSSNGQYHITQNGMNPNGGYHTQPYLDHKTGVWKVAYNADLNIDVHIYNALYSALAAGCEVEGLQEAVDIALNSLSKVHSTADGGFNKTMTWNKKGTRGTFEDTAAGTLYIYLMGGGDLKQAKNGLTWLENFKPNGEEKSELKMDWKNLPGKMSILGWYYMTQALFQGYCGTGKNWKRWNSYMITTLKKEQHKDGYWPCPSDKYPVYEDYIDSKGKHRQREVVKAESSYGGFTELNGRIWATMYFCLCLEVYYRYLPTYSVGTTKIFTKEQHSNLIKELDDLSLD